MSKFAVLLEPKGRVARAGEDAITDRELRRDGAAFIYYPMDRLETLFNLAEGAFWSLIALGMAIGAFRHAGKRRRVLSIASAAFALFGISDWIEAQTGSWWEPWWLLVLKVGCVAVLILALRKWFALTRTEGS